MFCLFRWDKWLLKQNSTNEMLFISTHTVTTATGDLVTQILLPHPVAKRGIVNNMNECFSATPISPTGK